MVRTRSTRVAPSNAATESPSDQLHALLAMDVREHRADLFAEDAGQWHADALDGRHLDPELAQ